MLARIPRLIRRLGAAACGLALLAPTWAAPDAHPAGVPPALQPWIEWVRHDIPDARCPRLGGADERICSFASAIVLSIDPHGADFRVRASAYRDGTMLPLPGQAGSWPQDVRIDGAPAAVVAEDGKPRVELRSGTHRIAGRLAWQRAPAQIVVPPQYALVQATLRGRSVAPDEAGILWLARDVAEPAPIDAASWRIFRRIIDEVPAQAETAIELTVAGRPRELTLPRALLPGHTALRLAGVLPMKLDGSSLRVQAVAGRFWLRVTGRQEGPLRELQLPPGAAPEVWSFAAIDELRRVEVHGPQSVDPRQADVPGDWQSLPAWKLAPGQSLAVAERHRGVAAPSPGSLLLERSLWLDEDGGGLTFRDRLGGDYDGPQGTTAEAPWRLDMIGPYDLGRAALDGQDQYLTHDPSGAATGIEVRGPRVDLVAEGRAAARNTALPVSGWNTDLQGASIELHVGPGWRLLHASGVAQAQGSWFERWTLWDLFLTLLIALAAWRVFGRLAGASTALALALTWTVPGSPGWLWLVPIVGAAVQGAATRRGRLQRVAMWIKQLGLLALGLSIVVFSVGQLRGAMHPALEQVIPDGAAWYGAGATMPAERKKLAEEAAALPMVAKSRSDAMRRAQMARDTNAPALDAMQATGAGAGMSPAASPPPAPDTERAQRYESADPAAKVQTGPGVPSWQGRTYSLSWAGPVKAEQTMRLWLAPPWLVRLGTVAGVTLLLVALWRFAGRPGQPPREQSGGPDRAGGSAGTPASNQVNGGSADTPAPNAAAGGAAARGTLAASLVVGTVLGALLLVSTGNAQAQGEPAGAAGESAAPAGSGDWALLLGQLRERLLEAPTCAPTCAGVNRLTIRAQGGSVELRIEVHAMAESVVPLPGGTAWRGARNELDGQEGDFTVRGARELAVRVTAGTHVVTRTMAAAGLDEIPIALPSAPAQVEARLDGWSLAGLREDGTAEDALNLVRARPLDGGRGGGGARAGEAGVPPCARIQRTVRLASSWHVETAIERIDGGTRPQTVEVALLPGESVTTANVRVVHGAAQLTLGPGGHAGFSSDLPIGSPIDLTAAPHDDAFEVWNVEASTLWNVQSTGVAPVRRTRDGRWSPQWRPWPGESVRLAIRRPEGADGGTLTIDAVALHSAPGEQATDTQASVVLRSSLGATQVLALPPGARLHSLSMDGLELPVYAEGSSVPLRIEPGTHRVALAWREERGITTLYSAPRLELGAAAVNLAASTTLPADRWLLLTWGPVRGPAVLFWSMLLALVGLAWAAARLAGAPLSRGAWIGLAIGAGQGGIVPGLILLGFVAATGARARHGERLRGWSYNAMQIGYVLLAAAAVAATLGAIHNGLLGGPSMMVQGEGSTATELHWYQDRSAGTTPATTVISVPMWVWRLAMLAWSAWIAWTSLRLARWAWQAFSTGGRWRAAPATRDKTAAAMGPSMVPPMGPSADG